MKRRQFIQNVSSAGLVLGGAIWPLGARAADHQVIVVGGGMAGAAVAKYIRLWSQGEIGVALIEKDARYTSNIMSNEVLTGKRASVDTLAYGYSTLESQHGVKRLQGTVTTIDTVNRTVTYTGPTGARVLTYERLVLAPGLEFDLMPGMAHMGQYDTVLPHAWRAGAQTTLLRDQIRQMPDPGKVVITIPLAPYRCPPGPYERACVLADWLRVNKPGSQVIVLDANPGIQAQAVNFQNAFNGAYGYRVDYRPGSTVTGIEVSPGAHKVSFSRNGTSESLLASVLNPIPAQRAPDWLQSAGLLNGRFAPVNLLTYESTLQPGVHIIGDACVSGMPKAGHIGNQEGKTCANAIVNLMKGARLALQESAPVLNSACFTPVTRTQATWLSAVYQYSNGLMVPANLNGVAQPRAAASASAENYSQMEKWFKTLMTDTFA